jgi:hypothetical protein
MINNINLFNNLFNAGSAASSGTSKVDEIVAAHKEEALANKQDKSSGNSHLYLSTRAQKIHSLSNEFFGQGGLNLNDIDSLKERAYELGLISKQEYSNLTKNELIKDVSEDISELPSQNITHFIDDFLHRIDNTGSDAASNDGKPEEESETLAGLISALSQAKEVLSDVNEAKKDVKFKESLISSLSFLKEVINSEEFEMIPLDDRGGLSKVYQALEIVDKISPQRLSNDKLNRYMQVAFE